MNIAYSALAQEQNFYQPEKSTVQRTDNEVKIRYMAYLQACNKLNTEIAAIQKYFPGWMPKFQRS